MLATTILCAGAKADDQILKPSAAIDSVALTPEAGDKLFKEVGAQFESENPGVKIEVVKIPGSYANFLNKLSLLFRSPETAPDVAEVGSFDRVQWIESGYFADMTSMVADSEAWKDIPGPVRAETTLDGKVYAISHGEDTVGLLYDRTLLAKAGIPTPWRPKTRKHVLDASRKLKAAALPDVWPLWMPTGTAQGSVGAIYGPSLLLGSSDPAVYDNGTNKWVVDSRGLREVVDFCRTAATEGLLAPASQMLDANELATPPTEIPKHHIGITLAGTWFGLTWRKEVSAPYYPDAAKDIGFTPLPTGDGHAPGVASTLGGWGFGIYASSKMKDLAWKFIQLYLRRKNVILAGVSNGQIPPTRSAQQDESRTSVDPFDLDYRKLIPDSVAQPVKSGFGAWATGLLTATETVVLDPKVSTDDVVMKMNASVSNRLGSDAVDVEK